MQKVVSMQVQKSIVHHVFKICDQSKTLNKIFSSLLVS